MGKLKSMRLYIVLKVAKLLNVPIDVHMTFFVNGKTFWNDSRSSIFPK